MAKQVKDAAERLVAQVGRVMVGTREPVEQLLAALLVEGHVLLDDVPGVGKTTLARAVARSLDLDFRRVQCTPDIVPSDITGVSIFDQRVGRFEYRPGPLMANVVLVDEINRATPRAQSSLLEAMQERQVTVDEATHPLPDPFFVIATQNPIELEGTFPLPEAQLDRFLLKVDVPTPSMAEELEIVHRMSVDPPRAGQVITLDQLVQLQQAADSVFVHEAVSEYAVRLVMATRDPQQWGVPELLPLVVHGASPRGSLGLVAAARSLALLRGRDYALPVDVAEVAADVLSHRLVLTYDAIADGVPRRRLIERVLERVAPPAEAPAAYDDGAA